MDSHVLRNGWNRWTYVMCDSFTELLITNTPSSFKFVNIFSFNSNFRTFLVKYRPMGDINCHFFLNFKLRENLDSKTFLVKYPFDK